MTSTPVQTEENWQNLFGVCACLGEDFGFNPILLRVPFGIGLIWSPTIVLSLYFGLGAVVLLSRLMVPKRRRTAKASGEVVAFPAAETVEDVALPLAA